MAVNSSGGGLGQAAKALVEEMNKQGAESVGPSKGGGQDLQGAGKEVQQKSFKEIMTQETQRTSGIQETQRVQQNQQVAKTVSAAKVLNQSHVKNVVPTSQIGAAKKERQSKLHKVMTRLFDNQDKLNKVVDMALSSKRMEPQELLALQASVFRFSHELELTGKVVEKSVSGVKQTMNTQV